MRRLLIAILLLCGFTSTSFASEYCMRQYEGEIRNVNAEVADIAVRSQQIDARLTAVINRRLAITTEISEAANKQPIDVETIRRLSQENEQLEREYIDLRSEGFRLQDRAVELKGVIPANLAGRLRGCVEATAPTNTFVNLTIQVLAIYSTAGLSLTLPPKSLYVDMSAVLSGYPTGGPQSAVNQAREAALNALGIGGRNNDIGRIIRDPGRAVRCIFGC